jgi:hypothetical protein
LQPVRPWLKAPAVGEVATGAGLEQRRYGERPIRHKYRKGSRLQGTLKAKAAWSKLTGPLPLLEENIPHECQECFGITLPSLHGATT